MKRFSYFTLGVTLLVVTLSSPQRANAQLVPVIANNGFETWAPQTVQTAVGPRTVQVPQSWQLGFFSTFKLLFTGIASFDRSPVAHTGTASAQITIGADSSGGDVIARMAVASNPLAFVAWARNSAVTPDSTAAFALVLFTRTVPGGQPDTVAVGGGTLNTQVINAWERKVWPIIPLQAITPDSAMFWVFRAQGVPGQQTWIDDVSFTNSFTTGLPASAPDARTLLSLSPNPTSAGAASTLTVPARAAGPAVLTVTDIAGRTAGRVRLHKLTVGDNQLPVPTAGLPAGIYVVTVLSADGTRTARFVIE